MTTEERCPRCGGTTGKQKGGSITQWIAVCNCASRVVVDQQKTTEPLRIQICAKCGKRLKHGRAGSLTQWVFRQDLCACDEPEPTEADADLQESAIQGAYDFTAAVDIDSDSPLDVDVSKFPLERFTPLAELGKGGSGTVYYCRDKVLQKNVAVKCLNAVDSRQLVAFQNEARAASKLNHPNIVKILDLGATAGGALYMAMDLIDGVSLEQLIASGEVLSINETVEIFSDVCRGLAHAHAAGVLHRDVTPSNLLVSNQKPLKVFIIDFGVAVLQGNDQGTNLSGTPGYMPPDQARGEDYDQRSEVYELGCSLFEALTGSPPFTGQTAIQLLRQQTEQEAPSLTEIKPEINFPDELEAVVAKCLSKEKSDRFQNMTELAQALSAVLPRPPQIEEEPLRSLDVARKGGYLIATALVVLGVVAAAQLGLRVLQDSQKLTEEKVPVVPEHSIYGPVLVDAAFEIERPRFEKRRRDKQIWWFGKGAVTNDSLIDLARRKDIDRLSLIGDTIDGRGLVFIQELPLKGLDLASTQMRDKDIDSLYKFHNLEVLGLENTHVTSAGIEKLQALQALEDLEIGGPTITDDTLAAVAKLRNLKTVEVKPAPKITAAGIEQLAAMPKLENLILHFAQVDRKLLKACRSCKTLENIRLSDSKIDEEAFTALAGYRLGDLSLRKVYLTDAQLQQITSMKSLGRLDLLGSTGFSADGLKQIRKRFPKCAIEMSVSKKKSNYFTEQ